MKKNQENSRIFKKTLSILKKIENFLNKQVQKFWKSQGYIDFSKFLNFCKLFFKNFQFFENW